MQIKHVLVLLIATSPLAVARTGVRGAKVLAAPAPGPAPGPSGPSIDSVSVTFEVKNLNYFDLTEPLDEFKDEISDKMGKAVTEVESKAAKKSAKDAEEKDAKDVEKVVKAEEKEVAEGAENVAEGTENAEQQLEEVAEDIDKGVEEALGGGEAKLLQLSVAGAPGVHGHGEQTVAQALKHELKGAVKHCICADNPMFGPGPAPATGPAPSPAGWSSIKAPQALPGANLPPPVNPASLLAISGPAPGPAPGPATFCSDHGSPKTAVTTFTISNISFDLVAQKPEMKKGFEDAVKASTAATAGTHFASKHVKVTMAAAGPAAFVQVHDGQAPSGIAVTTALTIPPGVETPHMDPASLASHVETGIHSIPGIETVSSGQIHVKEPHIQLPVETGPHIHVAFSPGEPLKKKHAVNMVNQPKHGEPRSTLVTVSMYDRPGNGLPDMALAQEELAQGIATGELHHNVFHAFKEVTGFRPVIWRDGFKLQAGKIWAWDEEGCERQMTSLISHFTKAYTKRQVPMALFNECTNFITKLSFSHDYVLDPHDTFRCRKATVHFAQKWHLGKNQAPDDFQDMCHTFCEHKFGNDAPMCHITHGANLAEAPL